MENKKIISDVYDAGSGKSLPGFAGTDHQIEELKREMAYLKNELRQAREREAELEETRRAMLFMMEDLNESQEAIIHVKEEWVKTFDGISDPIFIHDKDYRIVRANKAYRDAAGLDYEEMKGRKYWEIFPFMKGPLTGCSAVESSDMPVREEVVDSASEKIFRVRCYMLEKTSANSALFVHVMENITEVKRVQDLLVQSAKLASIGELAANVAHEINNPMTAVLGYASLILEDIDEEDPLYADVKVIEKESYRIKEIIRKLLDFARQRKVDKKAKDINAIVKESISLVNHMAVTSNILIELDLDETLPPVAVDANQMKQVFINLMGNAVHAMNKGGTLRIKTGLISEPGGGARDVVISFRDDGCGIPKSFVDRVFDPFFSSKGEGGTGLGLSVSYGIVKNHGGRLTLKSEEGKGSEFCVILPISPGGDSE